MPFVICETVVAVVFHAREYAGPSELSYTGHSPRPLALCGAEIAWDTKIPVTMKHVTCKRCRELAIGKLS